MPGDPAQPRILLLKFSALGDLLLLSRAILYLRTLFPGCRLDLLTSPAGARLYRHSPYFERIDVWRRRALPLQPWQFLQLARRFRGRRYDLLVDLQSNKASGLMTLFIDADRVVRSGYGPFRRIFLGKPNRKVKPTVAELVTAAGFPVPDATAQAELQHRFLDVGQAAQRQARELLAAHGRDARRPLLAIAPGSSPQWPTKRWPARRFAQLVCAPELAGMQVAVLGDATEQDMAYEILAGVRHGIDLCGATPLELLPALVARCTLLIGNDSALVHVAAAVGVPTVTLFGPTLAARHKVALFYPGRHIALQAEAPCTGKYGKTCDLHPGRSCLDSITTEAVAAAASDLLESPRD